MSDEELIERFYIAPSAVGGQEISIDLSHWAKLEARIKEISVVTPVKAPELLASFNRAALEADKLAISLELEYQASVRAAEKLKAQVLLDKVPKYLVEHGMQSARNPLGSADVRDAIVAQDDELNAAYERADLVKAAVKLMRGKYEAFERAFRSVRTLVGEQSFNFGSKPYELSHGRDAAHTAPVGVNSPQKTGGFGTPKYDFNTTKKSPVPAELNDIPY